MSISERVSVYISQMQPGTVFLLSDIATYGQARKATTKAVQYYLSHNNVHKSNISKIANGLYYKDEMGLLGKLPPSFDAILHALTYSNGSQVGYIVGHQLFHRIGLSTQVPATVSIVTSKQSPPHVDFAGIKIKVKNTKSLIEQRDIKRLELAYILNNIGTIQSLESDMLNNSLADYFDLLQDSEQFEQLYQQLTYKRTKALLGALIEHYQSQAAIDMSVMIDLIEEDLSHRSQYQWGHLSEHIDNGKRWGIRF
jgi:hypothetical protein